eukprot:scaffold1129_cov100-Isochrysis_galbana.AAC.2
MPGIRAGAGAQRSTHSQAFRMFNINIRAMIFRRTTCEPETCHEQIVLHLSPIYYLPPISVGTCASALRMVLSVALALAVRCAALCPAAAMYGDGAARLGSRADCQRPAERSECSQHARAGTDGGDTRAGGTGKKAVAPSRHAREHADGDGGCGADGGVNEVDQLVGEPWPALFALRRGADE